MVADKWDVIISHMGNYLQSVLSIRLKLGISQQKGYHSGRDEDSTLGLHRVENCRLWGRCG